MSTFTHHSTAALAGMAVFLSGLQFSIASVEMSSRFSVENFAVSQVILQNACNALSTYIVIGLIWTVATCLVLFADYGFQGIFWGVLTNGLFMGWLILSYMLTFRRVAKKAGLQMPKLFHFGSA